MDDCIIRQARISWVGEPSETIPFLDVIISEVSLLVNGQKNGEEMVMYLYISPSVYWRNTLPSLQIFIYI